MNCIFFLHLPLQMLPTSLAKTSFFQPKTSYEITNLQRDSLYYVQLQAISTNGRKRLKSSNESRMLDTTTDVLLNPSEANALLIEDEAEIRYQFQPSKKYGMLVRVSSDCSFNGRYVFVEMKSTRSQHA